MSWWCAATGAPWSWTWQAFPGIWIVIALLVGSYTWALRSLQPARFAADDQPVTRREIALFGLGVLALWVGMDWPVGLLAAGYLLSARTLQNLLFVMVAPPLLLLGTPRWLLRRLLRGRLAFRAARWLTRPLLPLLLYNAVLIRGGLRTRRRSQGQGEDKTLVNDPARAAPAGAAARRGRGRG